MLTVSNSEICESIKENNRDLISIKIKFPVFEGDENVCKKLNNFYLFSAKNYFEYFKTKHYEKMKSEIKNGTFNKKNGAVINWQISFLGQNALSVLNDISFFDGSSVKSTRLVQNWNLKRCVPLNANSLFQKSANAKKAYLKEICNKISSNEANFSYLKNPEKLAEKYFDFENFYLVPKGIAFFYEKNKITNDKSYPSFIIPFQNIQGFASDFVKL